MTALIHSIKELPAEMYLARLRWPDYFAGVVEVSIARPGPTRIRRLGPYAEAFGQPHLIRVFLTPLRVTHFTRSGRIPPSTAYPKVGRAPSVCAVDAAGRDGYVPRKAVASMNEVICIRKQQTCCAGRSRSRSLTARAETKVWLCGWAPAMRCNVSRLRTSSKCSVEDFAQRRYRCDWR